MAFKQLTDDQVNVLYTLYSMEKIFFLDMPVSGLSELIENEYVISSPPDNECTLTIKGLVSIHDIIQNIKKNDKLEVCNSLNIKGDTYYRIKTNRGF